MTDPAGRPRRADATRNRERIVEAASELFALHGLSVQLDEVAGAAGVGVATVCRHFGTKEGLVDEVLNRARLVLIEQAEQCLGADDAGVGFRRFVGALVAFQSRYRALAEEMARRPDASVAADSPRHRAFAMITALVLRAQAAGELRDDLGAGDIAVLFAGIAHATTLTSHLDRHQQDRFVAVLLDGLRPSAASALPGHAMDLADVVAR